jgi:hypothetical protein
MKIPPVKNDSWLGVQDNGQKDFSWSRRGIEKKNFPMMG